MASVLLIEPDVSLAEAVSTFLEGSDFEVVFCHSSQAAITQADEHRPDIVVLELSIPDHNGVEFLQEFRTYPDWIDIPVIVYSHVPLEDTGLSKAEWRKHGVQEYLYKPTVGLAELAKTLREFTNEAV